MQIAAATDRKVKAKTADSETALVVAKKELKELEELRNLRRVWGERSTVPLKEQLAESKQTKVLVTTPFGHQALVHKEKFKVPVERYTKDTYTKSTTADEEEDPTYGSESTSTRLDTKLSDENLVWLLDYVESLFPGMAAHRETLLRCKESAQELFRNALPGWVLHDVDWAENFTIVKARMLQSEYWAQIQSSLLIGIIRWLDPTVFNDTVTPLEAKDEVTVISFVEMHGVTRVGDFAGGSHKESVRLAVGDIVGYKVGGTIVPVTVTEVHETEETTTTDIDAEMEQQTILVNVAYTVTAEAGAQYVNLARTELYERASYFAKIVAKDGDTYTLEDTDGNTHTNVPRSVLHKRKWISEAYCRTRRT